MAPELSVIIPAFNAAETLGRCLAALQEQEGAAACEIIVVDDASADATAAIARAAGVACLCQESNRGAAAARNRGARSASADLFLFVDADVALKDHSLRNLLRFFEQRPEISAAVGTYAALSPRRDACSLYHNFFTYYHHDLSGEEVEWFWGAIGAVRRSAWEEVGGFDERYAGAAAEDMQFGYELALRGRRIAYRRDVPGDHLHRFSLRSMLWNDYRKAVLGTKLYLTRKQPGRHHHGFSNPANAVALVAAGLFGLSFLGFLLGMVNRQECLFPAFAPLLCLAVFLLAGRRFYSFLAERMGFFFLAQAVPLHLLSFLIIVAGTVMGLIGLALGRPLQGKSPWL